MAELTLREHIRRRLHAYTDRKYELQLLEQQLERLEASITAPRIQAMDGMPHGHGGGDAMASIVAELVGLQEKYKAKILQLTKAQEEVEQLIDSLEPRERSLMRFRYIDGMAWDEVCVAMNYSWRQTHNIHSRALDQLVEAAMEKEAAVEE